MLLLHLELQTGIWLMHGGLIEVISKRPQFFIVCLGRRRGWTHWRTLLFNLCMSKRGFVWGAGIILYFACALLLNRRSVQCRSSWWAVLSKMPQAGMIGCMWAGFSGSRQPLPAYLARFHWFIGNRSIWWIDFQDLYVSNRLLWLSNAPKPGRSYHSLFLRLTVFYLGGLASTAWEDWSTNFWPNLQDSLWPCDQWVFVFLAGLHIVSPLSALSCTAGHSNFHPFNFHLLSIRFNLWVTRTSLREYQW